MTHPRLGLLALLLALFAIPAAAAPLQITGRILNPPKDAQVEHAEALRRLKGEAVAQRSRAPCHGGLRHLRGRGDGDSAGRAWEEPWSRPRPRCIPESRRSSRIWSSHPASR